MKLEALKGLEQKTALQILYYLKDREPTTYLSKLMDGLKEKDAKKVNRGIKNLVDLGLLIDHGFDEKGRGRKRFLELTKKGKRAANKIGELKKILDQ